MAHWFISDLHLDSHRDQAAALFRDFLSRRLRSGDSLYILGDLFEAWIGDDDDDPSVRSLMASLAEQSARDIELYFMHGNRDFLIGAGFSATTGCELLGDYARIEVQGTPVLLMHGDLLCSDDTDYLRLRATLRDDAWQRGFLAQPLGERRRIAAEMRAQSQTEIAAKPTDIMDVNADTVADTLREHDVRHLLHGHTHRPAVHEFVLDGAPATRIVLGAWHDGADIVRWDESGFSLASLAAAATQ